MVQTHGLTHLSLAVKDPERALRFYEAVFGAKESYRDEDSVEATLGKAVLAFQRKPRLAGKAAGMDHFGFRLRDAKDIDQAVEEVQRAGGKLLRRGEFGPGRPYAYVHDLDGYEVEIWYE